MAEEKGVIKGKDAVEIQLILPKFDNSGNPINPEYIDKILKEFGQKVNDGFTIIPDAYGCWYNDKTNEVQCEENYVVETILDKTQGDYNSKIENLDELTKEIAKDLGQREILFVADTDDKMYEVYGEYSPISPESLKNIRINILPKFIR